MSIEEIKEVKEINLFLKKKKINLKHNQVYRTWVRLQNNEIDEEIFEEICENMLEAFND